MPVLNFLKTQQLSYNNRMLNKTVKSNSAAFLFQFLMSGYNMADI